jgi:hypothetical protein
VRPIPDCFRLLLLLAAAGLSGFPLAAQEKLFPPDAVVNVTLPPYNARPGQGVDNTAALQRAITENVGTGRVLYFPAGTYEISDTLVAKNRDGLWRAHLTLQGQGRDQTIVRLADHASGFGDPARPKAMLMTGSMQEKGDAADGGGNKAFRNNVFDLTLDTGTGNAGAMGIEYAVSNQGAIKNVTVRSGDGLGVAGISLRRKIPGPGLIKNVAVQGFEVGIDVGDMEYGITLEDVAVAGQRTAGIRVSENLLYVRHLKSVNRVPAILVTKPNGALVLLDSQLTGGAGDQPALDCSGSLLMRNVTTAGYREAAVRCHGIDVAGPVYPQYVYPAAKGADGSSAAASQPATALLPVEETPEFWNANLADWMPVGPRLPGEPDDTAAIQRALDSGKGTVYLPNNRSYFLSDTVVVRGKVRQILGLGSEVSLGAAKVPFGDREHPRPLIRIDPTDSATVFFEGIFFNAQYPGEVLFENNSPAAVVIKQCLGWVGAEGRRRSYRNTARATGRVFLEDNFLPGWAFTKQKVWARQFNPENADGDGITPQVANAGGQLWVLGFKTEGPAPFLVTTAGGTTELLGAYNYVSATAADRVPANAVPYVVTDATAALTFVSDNFRDNDYAVYIRETQGDRVHELKSSDLSARDGSSHDRSFVVPLYRSGRKD